MLLGVLSFSLSLLIYPFRDDPRVMFSKWRRWNHISTTRLGKTISNISIVVGRSRTYTNKNRPLLLWEATQRQATEKIGKPSILETKFALDNGIVVQIGSHRCDTWTQNKRVSRERERFPRTQTRLGWDVYALAGLYTCKGTHCRLVIHIHPTGPDGSRWSIPSDDI